MLCVERKDCNCCLLVNLFKPLMLQEATCKRTPYLMLAETASAGSWATVAFVPAVRGCVLSAIVLFSLLACRARRRLTERALFRL